MFSLHRLERRLQLGRLADVHDMRFHPYLLCRRLSRSENRDRDRIGSVREDRNPFCLGKDLAYQLEPLAAQLRSEARHARDIATGPGQIRHEADADDVG